MACRPKQPPEAAAGEEPDEIMRPTYGSIQVPYPTRGEEAGVPTDPETLLKLLPSLIKMEKYSTIFDWSRAVRCFVLLEHKLPRHARTALMAVCFKVGLAPGMEISAKSALTGTVVNLCRGIDGELVLRPTDVTLDWLPIFEQLRFDAFSRRDTIFGWNETYDVCTYARKFFDPADRVAILEKALTLFDTAHLYKADDVARMLGLLLPTTVAPESLPHCQPSALLPTLFSLLAWVGPRNGATSYIVELISQFAVHHVGCEHSPFGRYGIFDEPKANQMYTTISRQILIDNDDEHGDGAFEEPPIRSASSDWFALSVARWIVSSLSPLCLGEESSMLSLLERFIAAIRGLCHPQSKRQAESGFVGQVLQYLASEFCKRYNGERRGQLAVPPPRRINDNLKQRFVFLLTEPVLLGCFSPSSKMSKPCLDAIKSLAALEPRLVIPAVLQHFYTSRDSQVDGDVELFSWRVLLASCSAIAQERWARCHLPALMGDALYGIDASRLPLTSVVCQFIRVAVCFLSWAHIAKSGKSEGFDLYHDHDQRFDGEEAEGKDPEREEIEMLQSLFRGFGEFTRQFLDRVLGFLSNTAGSDIDAEGERDAANEAAVDAAAECLLSLPPDSDILHERMQQLSEFVASKAIPRAGTTVARLVMAAVQANPQKGIDTFVPMLIRHIQSEITTTHWMGSDRHDLLSVDHKLSWYANVLGMCLLRGGHGLLGYTTAVMELVGLAEEICKHRASAFRGWLIKQMLRGLTETFTTSYVAGRANQQLGLGDWGEIAKEIPWHVPSTEEIREASEIFKAETTWLEKHIRTLLKSHASLNGEASRKAWVDSLANAFGHMSEVFCGMATLFDPVQASAGSNANTPSNNDADDEADLVVSTHARTLQCVLEPGSTIYVSIHEQRGAMRKLAGEVHGFLTDMKKKKEYGECFRTLYKFYETFVGDVGYCTAHQGRHAPRFARFDWEKDFIATGVSPSHPPALSAKRMACYHHELQACGSERRRMGDLDKEILRDLVEGCSSPDAAVRGAAQDALRRSLNTLPGSAKVFLPLMVAKLRELVRSSKPRGGFFATVSRRGLRQSSDDDPGIENDKHSRIESALHTLIEVDLEPDDDDNKGMIHAVWMQDCPRQTTDLINALMETAATVTDAPEISKLAGKGITALKTPLLCERRAVSTHGMVEDICAADDCSETILKAREAIRASEAATAKGRHELGLQMISKATDPRIYDKYIGAQFTGFDKDGPPVEYIRFLVAGAVADSVERRNECIAQFGTLIRSCFERIRHGNSLESHLRTRDQGGRGRVPMDPKGDETFTHRFLAGSEMRGGDDSGSDGWLLGDSDDFLVDDAGQGSLLWAPFSAWHADMRLSDGDRKTDGMLEKLGSLLTQKWFETVLSFSDKSAQSNTPTIHAPTVELLTGVIQLMEAGKTVAKLEGMKDLVGKVLGDGTKAGQHIATATLLLALMHAPMSRDFRRRALEIAEPVLIDILERKMGSYSKTWYSFLKLLTENYDPERFPGLVKYVGSLRLHASDEAARSEAKLEILRIVVSEVGWRFPSSQNILDMLRAFATGAIPNLDVAVKLGTTLADVHTSRRHESHPDIFALIKANQDASPLGIPPHESSHEVLVTLAQLVDTVSKLRQEAPPDQVTCSDAYFYLSNTLLVFLSGISKSGASGILASPFRPAESKSPVRPRFAVLEELWHVLDARRADGANVAKDATEALRHLCRIPLDGDGEYQSFWKAVWDKTGPSHTLRHRTVALGMIRLLYLHRLWVSTPAEQRTVLEALRSKIQDASGDVQRIAADVLTLLLSRSTPAVVAPFIGALVKDSAGALRGARLPGQARIARLELDVVVSAFPPPGMPYGLADGADCVVRWMEDMRDTLGHPSVCA
ncbi:hypothetical protein AYO20_08403 [Fonsecaea nubica]|uniref:Proteasome activator Blm10 middle HEAT repeats region domain-containing protein n=1 Tax=Fonsecaea nubica TaxID=856822 RepID=A0A178CPK3_9EURO|nr:hypothetical protein AYO20_08403 [Fonsecaea nubica]OAL31072.1 hypothetical protein AYO20_08403 [Fonsecaea nubica]